MIDDPTKKLPPHTPGQPMPPGLVQHGGADGSMSGPSDRIPLVDALIGPTAYDGNLANQDRLTCGVSMRFEHHDDPPVGMDFPMRSWMLDGRTDEPYVRRHTVTTTPRSLAKAAAWFDGSAGYVLLYNRVGTNRLVNPTEEEAAKAAKAVVVVSYGTVEPVGYTLNAGRPFLACPQDLEQMYLQTLEGEAEIAVHVVPR